MSKKVSFDITAYSAEEVERIFSEIESSANNLQDHSEIEKLITKSLGGRLMLTMEFNPKGAPLTLYRVTQAKESSWFNVDQKSTFSYPPNPSIGRANIENHPVFYASLDPSTAIKELKNRLGPGKEFFVSEWKLIPKKTIYGHCLILNSTTESSKDQFLNKMADNHASQLESLFTNLPKQLNQGMIHAVRKMGDLFTIPGESKYHITSAYAHHIIYEARKQKAYMPILIFPSVENNHQSINFAIHPELIQDETIELSRVFKLSIPKDASWPLKEMDKIQVKERGIYFNKTIEWQTIRVSWELGNRQNLFVKTDKEELIRGEKILEYIFTSSKATIKNIIQTELHSENLRTRLEILAEKEEIQDAMNYKAEKHEEIFILDMPANTLVETGSGIITITNIVMPISWTKDFIKKSS